MNFRNWSDGKFDLQIKCASNSLHTKWKIVGGLLGTGIATYLGKGQFKSVPEILYNDLSNEQREDLAAAIRHVVTPQNVMTIAHLVLSFQSNEQLVLMVLNVVRNFLSSEMSMKVLW